MHYKLMFPSKYLAAADLQNKDVVVEIESVSVGEMVLQKGRKEKKPMMRFRGKKKEFALNKTNAKTIAALLGNDTDDWVGKKITLYPTMTDFGGEEVECVRVRKQLPREEQAV